jgi:hypothetical protein
VKSDFEVETLTQLTDDRHIPTSVNLSPRASYYGTQVNPKFKGRRNVTEFPDHYLNTKLGKYDDNKKTFDQEIDCLLNQAKEERPTALRSAVVEKYVSEILNKEKNPQLFELKLQVVKKMVQLRIDNRILNNMRQTMNENIEDERGLMSKDDFKQMFYTSLGRTSIEKK